jgi:pimeloyl-ACP methyl ester carboxylesterase
MERHEADGVSYVTEGPADGPVILFVHGGLHGSWCWADVQGWFADRGWRTAALDWFQHGDSDRLPEAEFVRRSLTDVSTEITTVLDALDADRPVLVGHSMGGLAVLHHAARSASRPPAALALLTPVVPQQFGAAPVELPVDLSAPWGPPPPEVARQLFYSAVDDRTAQAHYERLVPESPQAVWDATRWTVPVDVSAIGAPAYVVAAEHDRLVPPEYVRALATGMDGEFRFLPGQGHGVTLDPVWRDVAAGVETWLRATLPSLVPASSPVA